MKSIVEVYNGTELVEIKEVDVPDPVADSTAVDTAKAAIQSATTIAGLRKAVLLYLDAVEPTEQ